MSEDGERGRGRECPGLGQRVRMAASRRSLRTAQSTRASLIDHTPVERRWPTGTSGHWAPVDADRRAGHG